ncbi:MAG: host-nuclease inhibitor Gam family protein [Pseudomonadota bacterium]
MTKLTTATTVAFDGGPTPVPISPKGKLSTARVRAAAPEAPAPTITPLQQATADMLAISAAAKKLAAADKQWEDATKPLVKEIKALKDSLNRYADSIKAEFGTAKTMKLAGGIIGWKLGTRAVVMPKLEDDKAIEKRAKFFLETVRKHHPDAVEEVVNQKTLLTVWDSLPKMAKALLKSGISAEQKDGFFVTPAKL